MTLNKDAHYGAWYIEELFRSIFFCGCSMRCYFKARKEKDDEIEGAHEDDSSDDESGEGRVGTHVAGDAAGKKSKNKNDDENEKSEKSLNSSGSGKMLPQARELNENDLLDASEDVKQDYKLKSMALNLVILICGVGLFCAALLASGRYVTAPVVIYGEDWFHRGVQEELL